jgi:hypothetical protein
MYVHAHGARATMVVDVDINCTDMDLFCTRRNAMEGG